MAIVSKRVDFPDPLSPTKMVTLLSNSISFANRTADTLKGKGFLFYEIIENDLRKDMSCCY
jgi:hypothetical protein